MTDPTRTATDPTPAPPDGLADLRDLVRESIPPGDPDLAAARQAAHRLADAERVVKGIDADVALVPPRGNGDGYIVSTYSQRDVDLATLAQRRHKALLAVEAAKQDLDAAVGPLRRRLKDLASDLAGDVEPSARKAVVRQVLDTLLQRPTA